MPLIGLPLFAAPSAQPRLPASVSVPLLFVGQTAPAPQARPHEFITVSASTNLRFRTSRVDITTHDAEFTLEFPGSASIEPVAELPADAHASFLVGNDPRKWRDAVPLFHKVTYRQLYAGVDLTYQGLSGVLKADWIIHPGVASDDAVAHIRMAYAKASRLSIDEDGGLNVGTSFGTLHESPPIAYQDIAGQRREVRVNFRIIASAPQPSVGFEVGDFDHNHELVIDPTLTYSTYVGGANDDLATAIAVDSTGAVYVAGYTNSVNASLKNSLQSYAGDEDVYVFKLSPDGRQLLYATYIGGVGKDVAHGIAVDNAGAAYVVGSTTSSNFPTVAPLQAVPYGMSDAFVLKLNASGSALIYSTYFGGTLADSATAIALDPYGQPYIAGETSSADFPLKRPFQAALAGGSDAFTMKLDASGLLVYATFFGGSGDDGARGIAVSANQLTPFLVGYTSSPDLSVRNATQNVLGGGQDAFVARFDSDAASLLFGTYLGGSKGSPSQPETAFAIAVDLANEAYITGTTPSSFPGLPQLARASAGQHVFVLKLDSTGKLRYASYPGDGVGTAIRIDDNRRAYVTGYTASPTFPQLNTMQATLAGGTDAFLVAVDAPGAPLLISTYVGGEGNDQAQAIGLAPDGAVFLAGHTTSERFPLRNALQSDSSATDIFVSKITAEALPSGPSLSVSPTGGAGRTGTFTVSVTDPNGAQDLESVQLLIGTSLSGTSSCHIAYAPATRRLSLLNDSASQWSGQILGTAGIIFNSQCSVDLPGATAVAAGNTLSLTLPLSFANYGGTMTVYLLAIDKSGRRSDWVKSGTWAIPAPLPIPVEITVAPDASWLTSGQTIVFKSSVTGTPNTSVTWSVSPPLGTISSSGLYTAPPTIAANQTVTVSATSNADTRKRATATLTLRPATAATGTTAEYITKSTARLTWTTSSGVTKPSKILYGPTPSYGYVLTVNEATGTTKHSALLSGLAPSSSIHYCITWTDAAGDHSCGASGDRMITTAPDTSPAILPPEPPRLTVDTTMPAQSGQVWHVSEDCEDAVNGLQATLNKAAGGDTIVLKAGVDCYGAFDMPAKPDGTKWILIRTSTPDHQLPPPDTRIAKGDKPLMARIVSTLFRVDQAASIGTSAADVIGKSCNTVNSNYAFGWWDGFSIFRCANNVWQQVTPVATGTTPPPSCTTGTWFHDTRYSGWPAGDRKAWLCVTTNKWAHLRMAPYIHSGIFFPNGAHHYRFTGIEITTLDAAALTTQMGDKFLSQSALVGTPSVSNAHHIVFDRCYLHGTGYPGRLEYAFTFDGSFFAAIDSRIEQINYWRPNDTTPDFERAGFGFTTDNSPGPIKFVNNYVSVVGISFMTTSEGIDDGQHTVSDVEVRRNYFFKDLAFRTGWPGSDGRKYFNRHHLEIKKGERIVIEGNVFENNWGVKENGKAIWLSGVGANRGFPINDIAVRNNIIESTAVGVGWSGGHERGAGPTSPSGRRFEISNNLFIGVDSSLQSKAFDSTYPLGNWTQFAWFAGGTEDVVVKHNTIDIKRTRTSDEYESFFLSHTDSLPSHNLHVIDNIVLIESRNGDGYVFSSGLGRGIEGLKAAFPALPSGNGWRNDHNIYASSGLRDFGQIPDNIWLRDPSAIGLTDITNGDWSLSSASPYRSRASDGTDPGVNWIELLRATKDVASTN